MSESIELGDIGVVSGKKGYWIVWAGALNPENIFSASQAAREAAEPSEALTIHSPSYGFSMCWRDEFTRADIATSEQLKAAGF